MKRKKKEKEENKGSEWLFFSFFPLDPPPQELFENHKQGGLFPQTVRMSAPDRLPLLIPKCGLPRVDPDGPSEIVMPHNSPSWQTYGAHISSDVNYG